MRERLPDERVGTTHECVIDGVHIISITASTYSDGRLGEVFIRMNKEGSTLSGLLNTIAIETSVALQGGIPLRVMVKKFRGMNFEPFGRTSNPNIPHATSIVDYVFRWLGERYLPLADVQDLGL